jgi:hypothetical protein
MSPKISSRLVLMFTLCSSLLVFKNINCGENYQKNKYPQASFVQALHQFLKFNQRQVYQPNDDEDLELSYYSDAIVCTHMNESSGHQKEKIKNPKSLKSIESLNAKNYFQSPLIAEIVNAIQNFGGTKTPTPNTAQNELENLQLSKEALLSSTDLKHSTQLSTSKMSAPMFTRAFEADSPLIDTGPLVSSQSTVRSKITKNPLLTIENNPIAPEYEKKSKIIAFKTEPQKTKNISLALFETKSEDINEALREMSTQPMVSSTNPLLLDTELFSNWAREAQVIALNAKSLKHRNVFSMPYETQPGGVEESLRDLSALASKIDSSMYSEFIIENPTNPTGNQLTENYEEGSQTKLKNLNLLYTFSSEKEEMHLLPNLFSNLHILTESNSAAAEENIHYKKWKKIQNDIAQDDLKNSDMENEEDLSIGGTSASLGIELGVNAYPVVLDPHSKTGLFAQVNYPVVRIFKRMGDRFEKDEILIELENTVTQSNHEKAFSQLEEAYSKFIATGQLFKNRLASLFELKEAEAEVAKAKAELILAETNLNSTQITAPYEGVVDTVYIEEYEMPQSNKELIKILDDKVLIAKFLVPSKLLSVLKIGTLFSIHLSETDEVLEAAISRIGGMIDPASSTVKIEADIDNSEKKYKAGISGIATFEAALLPKKNDK